MTKMMRRVVPGLIVVSSFLSSLAPINDYDFWWHLKTGEYIVEHKALPEKDPFTYTFLEHDRDIPEMPAVMLKSYWLSQVIFFLLYHQFGPAGIIFLKAFVLVLILLILWKYVLERPASMTLSAVMLTGFAFFASGSVTERPQIFSFLFAAIVFFILERLRAPEEPGPSGERPRPESGILNRYLVIALPLIMLLWANMHRGYLVGMAFIAVYMAGSLFWRRSIKARLLFLSVCLASLGVTFLNPVTYHSITSFLSTMGSGYQNEALEFNPVHRVIPFRDANWYPFFVLIAVVAVIVAAPILTLVFRAVFRRGAWKLSCRTVCPSRVKGGTPEEGASDRTEPCPLLPVEHVVLLTGTAAAALSAARYGMFFMIIAVPVITVYLSSRFAMKAPAWFRRAILAVAGVMLVVLTFRSALFVQRSGTLIESRDLPVRAVEFIQQQALPAKLLNDVTWGGYLIWRLYPSYQVFSDTRALNAEIYRQYLSILLANEKMYFGVPEWRALLEMYGINTIIHSAVNPYNGEVWPLMLKLMGDTAWHLVYADGTAAILVRKVPAYLTELPKSRLLDEMRLEVMRGLDRFPNHPGFLNTLLLLNRTRWQNR